MSFCSVDDYKNASWQKMIENTNVLGTCNSGYVSNDGIFPPSRKCLKGGIWSEDVKNKCGKPAYGGWDLAKVIFLSLLGLALFIFLIIFAKDISFIDRHDPSTNYMDTIIDV